MIIIHAHIKVDGNQRKAFLEEAETVMAQSKAEDGNISYHLYEDTVQENAFVILEMWKDLKAIQFHVETPHYKAFMKEVEGMLSVPPEVERFEVAGKI